MNKGRTGLFTPEDSKLLSHQAPSDVGPPTWSGREALPHCPKPQVTLRCAKAGITQQMRGSGLQLWARAPAQSQAESTFSPHPPLRAPDRALPEGFAQAAITTQLSAVA